MPATFTASNSRRSTRRPYRRGMRLMSVASLAVIALGCSDDSDDSDDTDTSSADASASAPAVDALTAELAAATERADAAEASLAAAQDDLEEARSALDQTGDDLDAATARADEAEASVEQLTALFPLVVNSDLDGLDLSGTYDVVWEEAYCDTFSTCGTVPATTAVTLAETPEGWLELDVPGVMTVPLFAIQGSLYGIADSELILPPCGATPQVARVAVTMYADGVTIVDDGSRVVDRLGASVSVSGSFADGCQGGVVFYGVEATPVA